MNIVITRYRKKAETVDGHLTIDGVYICDTAENTLSAIPAGIYPISIVKCKQHARKMPVLGATENCKNCRKLNCVSNNTTMPVKCPMLKPGNGVYHRGDSSIILGTYICPGCLKLPKQAFDSVYDRLRKSAERQKQREQKRTCSHSAESRPGVDDSQRGHQLTLTIKESYKQ